MDFSSFFYQYVMAEITLAGLGLLFSLVLIAVWTGLLWYTSRK